ncbi:DUF2232 domain-containing protein [Notoacmeibacter sp. MSK16QG-6]|uniref:DUF2232 domain-containing protein n=1 Tax=Notoacmeibacter sp. MSK16QG-6 TaxID=2957982 RepID=UPI00209E0A62|nr:DUF2232 domain-containing protein [Notoacmeibacter sp. MSK16QG-6]
MKTILANPHLIGALAGLTSALVAASPVGGMAFLTLLSPFPLLVATLGYGVSAGLSGSAVAIAGIAVVSGLQPALGIALLVCVPSVLAGSLGALARPASELGGPDETLVWFPMADILLAICGSAAVAFVALSLVDGLGLELADDVAAVLAESYRQGDVALPDGFEGQLAALLRNILPIVQPFGWVLVLLANFYIALQVARRAGLLVRPKDDWPTSLRLPRIALAPFLVALLASFAPGLAGYLAAGVAGAFGAGFAVGGFAMLHEWSRQTSARFFILFGTYVAVLLFAPLLAGFVIAGLFDTKRASPLSPRPVE